MKLGEVIVPSGTVDPTSSPNRKFRYVDVSSVSNETFSIENAQEILGCDAPSRARRLIKSGDLIFATVRPTLKRIAIVPDEFDGQVCSTGYFVFRTKPFLDSRFLFYHLLSDVFMAAMESLQTGASYPAVNDSQVKQQIVAFPPLPEQRRIVALLDEAFEGLAIATANTERNLKNAREVFESYLKTVFTQKGVGWIESRLGDVCDLISGQHIEASDYNNENRGIAYLTGPSDFGELHPIITKWTEKPKRTALQDDILITVKGSGVGKINLLDSKEVAISRQLMAVRTKGFSTKLLYWFLSLKFEHFQSLANGAAIPGISRHDVLDLKFSFPAGNGQTELVGVIENISSLVMAMESLYQQKLAAIAELKQALLKKAFAGELTKEFSSKVVALPLQKIPHLSSTDLHAGILAIAFQKHVQRGSEKTFGHVKSEKMAHLAEAWAGLDLERNPVKDAAGPNDFPHFKKVESRAKKAGFFIFKESGEGYPLQRGNGLDRLAKQTKEALGDRSEERRVGKECA